MKKSRPLWAVICLIIVVSLLFCLFYLSTHESWQAMFVRGIETSAYGFTMIFLTIGFAFTTLLISLLGFGRSGVRMLNTQLKFFEVPVKKTGSLALLSSVILAVIGTVVLWISITSVALMVVYWSESIWKAKAIMILIALILAGLAFLIFRLAKKIQKIALKN